MAKTERLDLIRQIEAHRGSKVICYLTGDRGLVHVPIAEDIIRILYDHLQAGSEKPIDLFLYSRGGDAQVPWALVSLVRTFNTMRVLIPFKAHSAATLISLGADQIVMSRLAELGPVDPTVNTPFNPPNVAQPGSTLGVSVEDISGYVDFLKDRLGISDQQILSQLTMPLLSQLHPLALGYSYRFQRLSRSVAQQLLELHMDAAGHRDKIEHIVDQLSSKISNHGHKITRSQATAIGLPVIEPDGELEGLMWRLFLEYEQSMDLRKPILVTNFPPNSGQMGFNGCKIVYLESAMRTDVYEMDVELTRPSIPTPAGPRFGPQVQMTVTREEWTTE